MKTPLAILLTLAAGCLLPSCFTGVESTPRITERDIRRNKALPTPESDILAGVTGQPPRDWLPGKTFTVTDSRVTVAFVPVPGVPADTLPPGTRLTISSIDTLASVTGTGQVAVNLAADPSGRNYTYRTSLTPVQWQSLESLELPFMLEDTIVAQTRRRLVGNTYFIKEARRLKPDGTDTMALRYEPVTITAVDPGTDTAPLRLTLTPPGGGSPTVIMLTMGDKHAARRNFETIFTIDDPARQYKDIDRNTWNLIRHSKLAKGMTPREARLAVGTPDNLLRIPSTAGMIERWSFVNGVVLIFEDGVLIDFRQ